MRRKKGKYAHLIAALEPVATALLSINDEATVSDLREAGEAMGILVPQTNSTEARHRAYSCFGQVFRRIGAVNIGTRPATAPDAKGVRQVVWAFPSPYREDAPSVAQ